MTRKMKSVCKTVEIRVLREGHELMSSDEALRLACSHRQTAWIREIVMLCDGEPWLFARTVIPVAGPGTSVFHRVRRLGNQPLGQLLFSLPGIKRSAYEVARLEPEHPLMQIALTLINCPKKQNRLWTRRSVFTADKSALLLTEVFLPAMVSTLG